ncbi:MAG: tRNA uridine-5-carboxymethylaminomethyl(34) synthesis GTPase MnmE [Treponema sp.]|jgi:tRNA modification GTPase|nr:tRNA uridine-5-carboxymethylaminomethyl(34) synthesis GTPase MnmE [Treponema sp.]
MRNYGDTEPIAAAATAAGALTLIRTSGEGSLELLAGIFSRPKALRAAAGNTVIHGWIAGENGPVDEALVSVYRAPRSYTGEEGADISCHGGGAVTRAVMAALRSAGFADALPGEFTFRAFMNGKLDLTRSESVMELVGAETGMALERAIKRLSGVLEREINAVKAALVEILGEVELGLDYPEDEIPVDDKDYKMDDKDYEAPFDIHAVQSLLDRLRTLLLSFERERLYREGALAVIAGRPNAGKSSLFNALLNENRSIVSETPGTTRDWIDGTFSLGGIPVTLADTAGIREDAAPDGAEAQGIKRSRELLEEAALVLYVIDGAEGICPEDEARIAVTRALVPVWNKADLAAPPPSLKEKYPDLVETSAQNGRGLDLLCQKMESLLEAGTRNDAEINAGLGTIRQKELTEEAALALEEALKLAENGLSAELIAPCLREAVNSLGAITGEVSTADILEKMFSRFCLGK